jgi:hypothetical protein
MNETAKTGPGTIPPKKKKSPVILVCSACTALIVITVLVVWLFFFMMQKACEYTVETPDVFKPDTEEEYPAPPEPVAPEDFGELPDYDILDETKDALTVGVSPDISDDEVETLNQYLSGTYFPGDTMFNIAYVNRDDPESGEIIAVYNFNYFTGTDNLTILAPEPGARYPVEE